MHSAKLAWEELISLGLSPSAGIITDKWQDAVALLLTAPITITLRATYHGVSTASAIGLRDGRGLAAHQRSTSVQTATGTEIVDTENSVEVTLFNEENVWGACERLLPPVKAIRAKAKAAPLDSAADIVLRAGSDLANMPAPLQDLLNREEANVTMTVTAAAQAHHPRISAGMWSYSNGQLYSVHTAADPAPELLVMEVPAGHIANELIFAVLGAYDALDSLRTEGAL